MELKQRITDDTNKAIVNYETVWCIFKTILGFSKPEKILYKYDLDYPPGSKYFEHEDNANKYWDTIPKKSNT